MAKPIAFITIPYVVGGGMKWELRDSLQMKLEEKLPDYHVLVWVKGIDAQHENDDMEMQVFYEKDFTEIQYEELKAIIQNAVNNNTA